jgi:hypothetical protein
MPSIAYQTLISHLADVQLLLDLAADVPVTIEQRADKLEVLYRGGIVLAIAAWERFVEDVCDETAFFLIDNALQMGDLPNALTQAMIEEILQLTPAIQRTRILGLAGEGYKTEAKRFVRDRINEFHTPEARKVADLMKTCLGLKDVNLYWGTTGADSSQKERQLANYLQLRHEAAHQVRGSGSSITDTDVQGCKALVEQLAGRSEQLIEQHVQAMTWLAGRLPW